MPDISMCEGGDCPKKEQCYRFTATPCQGQYYSPFYKDWQQCQMFLDANTYVESKINVPELLEYLRKEKQNEK